MPEPPGIREPGRGQAALECKYRETSAGGLLLAHSDRPRPTQGWRSPGTSQPGSPPKLPSGFKHTRSQEAGRSPVAHPHGTSRPLPGPPPPPLPEKTTGQQPGELGRGDSASAITGIRAGPGRGGALPGKVEAAMSRASHLGRAPYLRGRGPSGRSGSGSRPPPRASGGRCQEETIGLHPPLGTGGARAPGGVSHPPSSPGLGGVLASLLPLEIPACRAWLHQTVLLPGVLPPGDPLASPPPSPSAGEGPSPPLWTLHLSARWHHTQFLGFPAPTPCSLCPGRPRRSCPPPLCPPPLPSAASVFISP